MRDRWLPVGVLAAALFAMNAVGRLVTRLALHGEDAHGWVSLATYSAIALLFGVLAFVRSQRYPFGRWVADLAAAALAALVFILFVGPFISGTTPFAAGAGVFFAQIWQYAAFTGGGALLGFLIATTFGWDYKSRSLKQFAQTRLAKPGRVIRR